MSLDDNKKYYYIKLSKDWFSRAEVQYLEMLENGNELAYLYLKLLVDSLGHNGELRISETIPYTPELLAKRMNTSVKVIEVCLTELLKLGAISIKEDRTIVIDKAQEYTSSITEGALRKARYKQEKENGGNLVGNERENFHHISNYNYNYFSNYNSNSIKEIKNKENNETELVGGDEIIEIDDLARERYYAQMCKAKSVDSVEVKKQEDPKVEVEEKPKEEIDIWEKLKQMDAAEYEDWPY